MPFLFAGILAIPSTALAQIPGTLEVGDAFGHAVASGDFDGDGFQDLAVGVPAEDVFVGGSTFVDAGGVNVVYGTAAGLDELESQFLGQSNTGVEDDPETADQFAYALAAGDFDGDGYSDLAVGVPFEDVGTITNAGAVNVLYGSAAGITATGDQLWHQDAAGVLSAAAAEERFGWSLTAGDFDGDGFQDLAIGVPYEEIGGRAGAGAVNVLYGSAGVGLVSAGNQFWSQNHTGVLDNSETDDFFGWSVAAGDFDGDGFSDLAIGVEGEGLSTAPGAGAVSVLYGSSGPGLVATGNQFWGQNTAGVEDISEAEDSFGYAVAAGDFDGDGFSDLAIGAFDEDLAAVTDAGAVNVLYGTSGVGLTATGDQLWHKDTAGIEDTAAQGDRFGWSLAAGDFDGNGADDLAIGGPTDDDLNDIDSGAVNVLYGSATVGLTATNDDFWQQDSSSILDLCEDFDLFGSAVTAGDFDGDGFEDLVIGAPGEEVLGAASAGAVNTIYGSASGLTGTGNQFFYQGASFFAALEGETDEAAEADPAAVTTGSAPSFALLPSSPNPFRTTATLRFTLPEGGPVRLVVYDVLGRAVAVLVDEAREAGEHAVAFDASSLPSGAYVVRLEAAGQVQTQRVTRLR